MTIRLATADVSTVISAAPDVLPDSFTDAANPPPPSPPSSQFRRHGCSREDDQYLGPAPEEHVVFRLGRRASRLRLEIHAQAARTLVRKPSKLTRSVFACLANSPAEERTRLAAAPVSPAAWSTLTIVVETVLVPCAAS